MILRIWSRAFFFLKPVKSVRFLTEEVPQTTMRLASVSSGTQVMGNSQSGSAALEHWNPSAIIGRDGSASVLKDTKTIMQRKGPGQNNVTGDGLPLSTKLYTVNNQSSPIRWVQPTNLEIHSIFHYFTHISAIQSTASNENKWKSISLLDMFAFLQKVEWYSSNISLSSDDHGGKIKRLWRSCSNNFDPRVTTWDVFMVAEWNHFKKFWTYAQVNVHLLDNNVIWSFVLYLNEK